jgi:hypothetical protein
MGSRQPKLRYVALATTNTESCSNKNGNSGRHSCERALENIVYCLGKYRVVLEPHTSGMPYDHQTAHEDPRGPHPARLVDTEVWGVPANRG